MVLTIRIFTVTQNINPFYVIQIHLRQTDQEAEETCCKECSQKHVEPVSIHEESQQGTSLGV
jgi:hypothetical protein